MTRSGARLALLCLLLALALAGGAFSTIRVFEISDQIAGAQKVTTEALCSLRADIRQRVDATDSFLRTRPRGIPGVPLGAIRVSLDNERHTLHALSPLAGHCSHRSP